MKPINYCETNEISTRKWFKNDILYRDDGPDVEYISCEKE